MDKKGFTLVELIATVVITSLVMGIATYSVIGIINNSRNKSEEIFVDKLEVAVDQFVGLYGTSFIRNNELNDEVYEISKCIDSSCNEKRDDIKVYEYFYKTEGTHIGRNLYLKDLVDENLFDNNKLINPVNKLDCLNGKNPIIRVFKDSDYVYYYYVDLSGDNTSCEISSENGVINTLPDDLDID